MKTKVCINCGKRKSESSFHSAGIKEKEYTRNVCRICRGTIRRERRKNDPEYAANERDKRNKEFAVRSRRDFRLAIEAYGGKCGMCGNKRIEFLLLHHKNGGGTQDRAKHAIHGGYYTGLRKANYPNGIEILCGNCHLSLHRKEIYK